MATKSTTKNHNGMKAQSIEVQEALKNIADLREQVRTLEERVSMARGTSDVTEIAEAITKQQPRVGGDLSRELPARIESTLRVKPRTLDELARELKEPAGRVSTALRGLKKHLFNAGTEEVPSWFWIVGDEAPTEQVNAAVEALVRYRPMRFPELLAATGARQGRVSGAIVALQRTESARLVNLDTAVRARWFIVPEGIQLSRLRSR